MELTPEDRKKHYREELSRTDAVNLIPVRTLKAADPSQSIENTAKPPEHPNGSGDQEAKPKWQETKGFLSGLTPGEKSTVVLGVIGALIAITTLYIMNRQSDLMDEQNKLVDKQNALMNAQNVLMGKQTESMDRQLKETREGSIQAEKQWRASLRASAGLSRRAMESSAAQSKAALDASITSSQLDQRPWVTISRFELVHALDVGKTVEIKYFLQNAGRTPALDVVAQSMVWLWAPPSEEPMMTKFSEPTRGSVLILAPSATSSATRSDPWSPGEIVVRSYMEKRRNLFIHARVLYRDIFGVRHWTTACAFHVFGRELEGFTACRSGNDMDRNQ
jgi:hypothetical protein